MDDFPQTPSAPADGATGRREPRDSLFLMADLRLTGATAAVPVRVRNLSAGGLMVEYADGLPHGLSVELGVRGIGWVRGKVAWSAAGRVGVAFDHPIDPIRARKPVGKNKPAPARPVLHRR